MQCLYINDCLYTLPTSLFLFHVEEKKLKMHELVHLYLTPLLTHSLLIIPLHYFFCIWGFI